MLASSKMTTTNANSTTDLIESKFNLLAGKILDELRQADFSREFFQALDSILNEHHETGQPKRNALRKSPSKHPERFVKATTKDTSEIHDEDFKKLKRQCEVITEKQRQQQEQLNNHQQILFDSQYRSLPAEITEAVASHEQRRANARLQAPSHQASDTSQRASSNKQEPVNKRAMTNVKGKTSGVKTSASRENLDSGPRRESPTLNQKQRSAIPQSTILSGISQRAETPTGYPISKSATVGANAEADNNSNTTTLKRQSSLRLKRESRETQKELVQQQQQQQTSTTTTRSLVASEKLRQRRPTKASLLDANGLASDDSDLDDDDEDDDDDDDDEFRYQNLASRRAYLNQRFINQQQEQPTKTASSEGAASAAKQQDSGRQRQVQSTVQSGLKQPQPANPSNMTVAKQRQRFSSGAQVVRSSTMATSRPSTGVARQQAKSARERELEQQVAHEHEQPRSLGGLLTSHDIGQLYKPHMNYSTSLLGNHRLSDDDEIIIIPTCQSPSLMSASVSPVPNRSQSQQQAASVAGGQQPSDLGNMDESSERFSISRTKSFWEKLANSKSGGGGGGGGGELESTRCNNASSPQQADSRNYFNSSQRSLSSGPNLVVDQSKSSQCSLHNQSGASHNTSNKSNSSHYPAAMKSAFDRMDSTGGSGNSHYSGASTSSGGSTSGDEQTLSSSNAGHVSLAERRAMLISAANAKTDLVSQKQRSVANASMNPTINQLVKQDQINRSDKFRQTR